VTFHWPQVTLLLFWAVALLLMARDHGKPKKGFDNFWLSLVVLAIYAGLLYFGGFFTQGNCT